MKELKGYRFRIYPDEIQRKFFIETFGCVRFTYNQLLMRRQEPGMEKATPAQLKQEHPFLKETDSLALANAQRNLERAFRNYYNGRAGYPKLKSKKNSWQSYTTNNQKGTVQLADSYLKLPKLKELVMVDQHREVKGEIKSATISAKHNQEFYVSLLCLEEIPPLKKTGETVKLTFNPDELISMNQKLGLPDFCQKKIDQKIVQAERKLACRKKVARIKKVHLKDAKNYQKQKRVVEQLHTTKANQTKDYLEQVSFLLVKNFDKIKIQNKYSNQEKENHTPTFQLKDWNQFLTKLKYKTQWYDKELIQRR